MPRSTTPGTQGRGKTAQAVPAEDSNPAPLVPEAPQVAEEAGLEPVAGQPGADGAPESVLTPEADGALSAPEGEQPDPEAADGGPASSGDDPDVSAAAASPAPEVTSTAPAAAPLAPPAPRPARVQPPSKVVEPNAAMRLAPEDEHVAIVDKAGDPVHHESLFADDGKHLTWVRALDRIYQTIRYPGQHPASQQPGKILLFAAGTRVPRDKAHQVMEMAKRAVGRAEGKPADGGDPDASQDDTQS